MTEENKKPSPTSETLAGGESLSVDISGAEVPRGIEQLAAAKTVSPEIHAAEGGSAATNQVSVSPPINQNSAPLSSETLFAFALPAAIQRRLVDNATQIFQKSEMEEILKKLPLPFKPPEPPPQTEPSQRKSEARVAFIIKALSIILYALVLLLLFKQM
jgi:hypothetical protein